MPLPVGLLRKLDHEHCAQRKQRHRLLNRIAFGFGLLLAISYHYLQGTDELIGAAILWISVWTLGRAVSFAYCGSKWRFGLCLVGAGAGVVAGKIANNPESVGLFALLGISISGNVSARSLDRSLILLSTIFAFPLLLLTRKGRSYQSLQLASHTFQEAVCRGDIPNIFVTAQHYAERLMQRGRAADLQALLSPIIELAGSSADGLPYFVGASVLLSAALDYQGNAEVGIRLLEECVVRCMSERDELLGRINRTVDALRSDPLIALASPRLVNYQAMLKDLTNNLMASYQALGDYDKALDWGTLALTEAELYARMIDELPLPLSVSSHPNPTLLVEANLADLLLTSGADPTSATEYIQHVKQGLKWKSFYYEEHAVLHIVEAKYALLTGLDELEQTVENIGKAIDHLVGTQGNLKYASEAILWMALVQARIAPLESKYSLERANSLDDVVLTSVLPTCSDKVRLSLIRSIRQRTSAYLSLAIRFFPDDQPTLATAFDLSLRRKGLSTLLSLDRRNAILAKRHRGSSRLLEEHTQISRRIALMANSNASSNQLRRLREQREELENELNRVIPERRIHSTLTNATYRDICSSLSDDQALIEFIVTNSVDFGAVFPDSLWEGEHYVAFVVTNDPENIKLIDLGKSTDIDHLIEQFIYRLTTDPDITSSNAIGRQLVGLLVAPLLPLVGGRNHLLLAPDGTLCRLPFEVLPFAHAEDKRIIDEYLVSYLDCASSVLGFSRNNQVSRFQPLIVVDPDFDLASVGVTSSSASGVDRSSARSLFASLTRFSPLPATGVEGEEIAAILGMNKSQLLRGSEALEAVVKSCTSPPIAHFATHGFFLETHGDISPLLSSGIVLAGANTWIRGGDLPADAEDGILTAEDVNGLDLSETELVVLSACDTGLGGIENGQGVFGLRRAFLLAGASSLVFSLWKVPDKETKELMLYFYQNIVLRGKGRAEALRLAQLSMKEKYPHPFYWGAFICQGNPAGLSWKVSTSQRR